MSAPTIGVEVQIPLSKLTGTSQVFDKTTVNGGVVCYAGTLTGSAANSMALTAPTTSMTLQSATNNGGILQFRLGIVDPNSSGTPTFQVIFYEAFGTIGLSMLAPWYENSNGDTIPGNPFRTPAGTMAIPCSGHYKPTSGVNANATVYYYNLAVVNASNTAVCNSPLVINIPLQVPKAPVPTNNTTNVNVNNTCSVYVQVAVQIPGSSEIYYIIGDPDMICDGTN